MDTKIHSIATGKSKEYTISQKKFQSAYKKDILHLSIDADTLGLKNDFQVDKRYHGGVDKAIHIGSTQHFELFEKEYNLKLDPLAIGCNIFITNYSEEDICVGDIYSIGEALIEVSQPRQPCWKIGALFGKEVSRYIAKNQATGWYVRVLQEGTISLKDTLQLKKRVTNINMKELSIYLHTPPQNAARIEEILHTASLADSYKKDFLQVLGTNNS